MSDKKRIKLATHRTSSEDERQALLFARIPGEILSRVAFWTYQRFGVKTLLRLGSASRTWRSACEPLLFRDLVCSDVAEVVEAAKTLGKSPGGQASSPISKDHSVLRHVEHLQLILETAFPTTPSRSKLLTSIAAMCSACTWLTSLRVKVRSGPVLQAFAELFPQEGPAWKALVSFSHLKLLVLDNIAIWLHDLAYFISAWPKLQALAVSCLRGDCVRSSPSRTAVLPCRLRNLRVEQSSLTNEMTAYFLRNQSDLRFLSLPVQSLTGRTLDELEKVMPSLTTLDIRDVWTDSKSKMRGKTPKKNGNKGAEVEIDDLDADEVTLPLPPLFQVLKSTACPDTVHLNRTLAPSEFFEAKGISQLTACMVEVETLSIDDFPPISPIYGALAAALKAEDLPFLKRINVTSSYSAQSSAKKTPQSKGLKELAAAAEARSVAMNSL